MSRVFNLTHYNNLKEALKYIYYPPSKQVQEKMTEEEAQESKPLPVLPFPELVEFALGRKIEKIDAETINQLKDYYLSLFTAPENIGPAFESVRSVAVDIEPTKRIEQLRAAFKLLSSDKSANDVLQMVKSVFGDKPQDLVKFKQEVFAKFNLEYDENLIAIFKQRVNSNTIPNIANKYLQNKESGKDNKAIFMVAAQTRQDYVFAAAAEYSEFVDKCRELGLVDAQIYWIITHGKDADPSKMPFFSPDAIDPKLIKDLLYENHVIVINIGRYFSDNPSSLFNQNADAMRANKISEESIAAMMEIGSNPEVGGAIARNEYLDLVNLSRLEIPQDTNDLFDSTYNPSLNISREEQMRLNPNNLNLIKSLLEKGGYVVGGKAVKRLPSFLARKKTDFELSPEQWEQVQLLVGQGKSLNFDVNLFPGGTYVDRALWYAANTLSGNKEVFRRLIESSGAIFENDDDGQEFVDEFGNEIEKATDIKSQMDVLFGEVPLIDEKYGDFNLEHDSIDQKRAIETLRNSFNLETVPSSMGIPALDDCNINAEGFQVDFIVICSALKNWQESNGDYHPQIDEQVNFVGEYYGFNFDFKKSLRLFEDDGKLADVVIDTKTNKPYKIKRIQHNEGLTMPDGSLAKVKLRRNPGDANKDKIEIDAKLGTPLDAGSEYKIREEWKKMTEDFAATVLGNASIHIPPDFTDNDIIQELNRCNIIYKYRGSITDRSPYSFVESHARQCQDANCPSKKTADSGELHYFKQYSAKEAMVVAKITEFKMTHGLVPKLREEKNKTAKAKMAFIKKLSEELNINQKELWNRISYKEFLDKFHLEHDLNSKGFGRHEIYQYYSEKVNLEKQLIDLIKSSNHSFKDEMVIRTQIINLKQKYLKYFQDLYDSHTDKSIEENSSFNQTLKKLEDLRNLVASGQDNLTNQQLHLLLESLFVTYVPQVVAQRKQALNQMILFKIAIKS